MSVWKRVDRVQKAIRGGLRVRFLFLVVGGNANGVPGFGIGKVSTPVEATGKAVRMHVQTQHLFYLSVFRIWSHLRLHWKTQFVPCLCLRMKRHPQVSQILKYAGIADCGSKSHGNQNQFNAVRTAFKALMTNERNSFEARKAPA